MKVPVKIMVEGVVDDVELAQALMVCVRRMLPCVDDCGLAWITDHHGRTYVGGPEWQQVSVDPMVAALVDASHVLAGDFDFFKLSDEDMSDWLSDSSAPDERHG